jgi:hypothetical protein
MVIGVNRGALSRACPARGKSVAFSRRGTLLLAMTIGLSFAAADAVAARIRLQVETPDGPAFYVYLARPVGLAVDSPIVIAVPDAAAPVKAQLSDWYPLAEAHEFLVAVPELPFPAVATGAVLDAIFATVRGRFGMTADRFSVYGHAAGAHYVQQSLLLQPQPQVARVVLAAPDSYTLPDFELPPPQGLAGTAVTPEQLRRYLQIALTVLFGDEDRGPETEGDPITPGAAGEVLLRFAEGEAFLAAGRTAAARMEVPFGWRLVTVPGAGDVNRELACAAVPYLLGEM